MPRIGYDHSPRNLYRPKYGKFLDAISFRKGPSEASIDCPRFPRDLGKSVDAPIHCPEIAGNSSERNAPHFGPQDRPRVRNFVHFFFYDFR